MKKRLLACCMFVPLVGAYAVSAQAEEEAAPFTGSVALTNDYTFRGITQTNRDPALQAGLQYDHPSGFYAGTWGSNISWLSDGQDSISSSVELDFYTGYKGSWGDKVSYDVGLNYYYYPGKFPHGFNSADTLEGYFAVTYSTITAKYSYAFTDLFGISNSDGSGYLDLAWNQPLGEIFTLNAHVGKQWVSGFSAAEYTDWKVGVTAALSHGFSVSAAYIDTNAEKDLYTNAFGKYTGKQTGIVTLTKAF